MEPGRTRYSSCAAFCQTERRTIVNDIFRRAIIIGRTTRREGDCPAKQRVIRFDSWQLSYRVIHMRYTYVRVYACMCQLCVSFVATDRLRPRKRPSAADKIMWLVRRGAVHLCGSVSSPET